MGRSLIAQFPLAADEWALAVIRWYSDHHRDLPWRQEPDPYRVLVSEMMLQQTQVTTVIPYFQRFVSAYPTLGALAAATEEEVLDLWAGLGYYRRARNLYRSARIVLERFDGRLPDDPEDLMSLPGVGRYSAGALLSIAFGKPYPVVDGNVKRSLARYLALSEDIQEREFWRLLETVVSFPAVAARVSDFNQGLMELGAVVCRPRNPECGKCPVSETCQARLQGVESEIPRPLKRARTVEETFTVAVIRENGRFLMLKNGEGPYLRGFWEFPKVPGKKRGKALSSAFLREHALRLRVRCILDEVRHGITFRRLRFLPVVAARAQEPIPEAFEWAVPGASGIPVSAYIHKILRILPPE